MPAYLYRCANCDSMTTEITSVAKRKKSVACERCGEVALRDIVAEHSGVIHRPGNWPMCSDAAGVHESQVGEAVAEAARVGVPTEFTSDGRAIFTSAQHRKRYCEAHGMFDRNGGYSDPQRKNR